MPEINQTTVTEFIFIGFSQDPNTNLLIFLIFLIGYITTLLGNIIIITLIITDQHLHSPMYYLLSNLSAIDMLFTSCSVPIALSFLLSLKRSISFSGCLTQMYVSLLLVETEFILLAVMAYDRYVAICSPLHYTTIMNKRFCGKLMMTSWLSGVLCAVTPVSIILSLPFCGPNKINHLACEYLALLSLACTDTTFIQLMLFPITIAVLLLPFTFIIVSYVLIIKAVLKISSAGGRYRTFSTCSSHLTVVCMFYGPAIVLYIGPRNKSIHNLEKYISLFYGFVTPLLNPIIYSMRNIEVKRALIKAFTKIIIFVKK